ncbi:nucleotide-binding protein [Microlunatus ginsengisoli]|uniref:CobQ/CobB/MinD/ParA nucleotide binding domain-containing protein n=1 Tax=Microlunatus ginsengisoli TaxID=363863 RepID=A0ABP7AHS8_9ACTN
MNGLDRDVDPGALLVDVAGAGGAESDAGLTEVPGGPSAPLGLVGLHDLAPELAAVGFEVVSDPDLRSAAQLLQSAVRDWVQVAGEGALLPVLILNSPRIAGLIPRIQRHVALTVLGTASSPVSEAEGYRSYQLPGPVQDIVKNAGVDGYDLVPDQLELEADGRLVDRGKGWDDWEPGPDDEAPPAVDEPADPERPADLGDAVFGVARSHQGRPSSSRIGACRIGLGQVALTLSGSGGVGKSTFSLALAARAAERGRRVVLVDANLGQGDLATFLRVSGGGLPTMFDAIVDGRNLENGIITPARLAETRAVGLRKPGFAFLQAPSTEELRTRRVTAGVVYELVEDARRIADLVVVDTQIVETDDPRRMVADLILPQLGRGGWAVAIAGLSTAGLANLNRLLTNLEAEGINPARVFSLLSRMPVGADVDQGRLIQTLRTHSVHLGIGWVDDDLQTALNLGDTLADQPALANLVDTLLHRIFDLEVVAPAYRPDDGVEPPRRRWQRWFDRRRSSR